MNTEDDSSFKITGSSYHQRIDIRAKRRGARQYTEDCWMQNREFSRRSKFDFA
jgi:hypothetical protein